MSPFQKDRYAETMYKRLYWQGYAGRFGSFRWPTRYNFNDCNWFYNQQHFDKSEFRAWASAAALRHLLINLKAKYTGDPNDPKGLLRLTAHSMGAIVAGEALNVSTMLVHTYVPLHAAVVAHAYDETLPDAEGYNPINYQAPNLYANYWNTGGPAYFNGAVGANSYINFVHPSDNALEKWRISQILKPDAFLNYRDDKDTGKYYRSLLQLSLPNDRYEIFSFIAEGRSRALGAQENVAAQFQMQQVRLTDDPYKLTNLRQDHSASWRSTNMKRAPIGERLLISLGLQQTQ